MKALRHVFAGWDRRGQPADGTAMLMVEIHWRLNNIMIPNKFLAVRDILNTFGCFNFYYRTS